MAGTHPHHEEIAGHFVEILRLLGLNAEDDNEIQGTPDRVAKLWADMLTGGRNVDAPPVNVLPSSGDQEDMVLVRDIPFYTTCAHHLTPIFGKCHIAYVPGEALIGVGTPPRILHHYCRRPQIQERLGESVASYLTKSIAPRGVMVHLIARHLCMEIRGPRTPAYVETTATRGWFSDREWRQEFFERMALRAPV